MAKISNFFRPAPPPPPEPEPIDAISVMHGLLWADQQERERIQKNGMHLIPSNFYSSIPSIAEIQSSYEYTEEAPPYLDPRIFNEERLRKELVALSEFSADFEPPMEGDEETCRSFFWKNSQFSYCDAMSLYAYVRRQKPKTIVEIGSGFSSLASLAALDANGTGRLKCVEPYPRPFISALAEEDKLDLLQVHAQHLTAEMLNEMLDDGDILFIDSTHTVKTGSDCLHIYLRLLPKITKKILVHVHDIFLPFGMPKRWLLENHIYWTEQYLLLAWMTDNPKVSVKFGSAYHKHFNPDLGEGFMHGRHKVGGGSFWLDMTAA